MAVVTALYFIRHRTVALATQIHDIILRQLFTDVLQKTEINHTIDLCVKAAN